MTAQAIKDRPISEIVKSVHFLIAQGKVKGQIAHDLESLCAQALRAPHLDMNPETQLDKCRKHVRKLEQRELEILAERDEETATLTQTADELAFWKYQAICHRALLHKRSHFGGIRIDLDNPLAKRFEQQAATELEAIRQQENAERYSQEAPRDIGS